MDRFSEHASDVHSTNLFDLVGGQFWIDQAALAPQSDAAHLAIGRDVFLADRSDVDRESLFNPTLLKKRIGALVHLRQQFASELAGLVNTEVVRAADSHVPRYPVCPVVDDVGFPTAGETARAKLPSEVPQ